MVILDTDIMVDLLRRYLPAVTWLESLGNKNIGLPGYVVMELIQGCVNQVQRDRVQTQLARFNVLWPSSSACDRALTVFARLHLSHGLGIIDALVGQTAVALNFPLHTFNQRHYAAIPDLQTVQPYSKS